MREAIRAAQEDGIVFIDEIDKIITPHGTLRHGGF
jgi:ATP-dependent protease HslVU (ClpYQ) ATPase subunit